jgi:Mce-associated membrane protein
MTDTKETAMPAEDGGTLKLIKGGANGSQTRTVRRRTTTRRSVTRRTPDRDPVAEVLERLDEEPAIEPAEDTADEPEDAPVEDTADEPDEDSADEPDEDSAEEPVAAPARKRAADAAEEPVAAPARKRAATAAEEPVAAPARKRAATAAEKRGEKRLATTAERRAVTREARRRSGLRRRPVRRRRRWPGRPDRITAMLLVALCLALAAAAVFVSRWYGDRQLDQAHQQAIAAAKQTTVDFVSVSAGSVDRDLQRIVAGSAGDFRDEFTRGQSQVRAAIVENNVDSRGTVLRAALLSGDRRHAVVLVAIDATVRNAKAPDGRQSHYRIQVELNRAGSGRWLVSRLQFVG